MLITWIGRVFFVATFPLYISALYVNSPDQGRRASSVKDTEQFRMIEQSLLRALGLSSRPRPRKRFIIPQYMRDLYHSHEEHPDWISTNFRFAGRWTAANTIRSYHHEDGQIERISPGKTNVLTFNVSTMPSFENVTNAQLRLYRQSKAKTDFGSLLPRSVCRVSIYQVMKPTNGMSPTSLRLLDSRQIDVTSSGWETFDVSPAVRHWTVKSGENYGLQVHTLLEGDQHTNHSVIVLSRKQDDATLSDDEWHGMRPLLVAYNHDGQEHKKRRPKRSAASPKKSKSINFCRRRPLYVDFANVGWDDWIAAPAGYEAYHCQGTCPFPLNHHLNSTNHAVVQTLVHNVDPSAAPAVCCVPTSLLPLNMLYSDASDHTVLKNYPAMAVNGCGCR